MKKIFYILSLLSLTCLVFVFSRQDEYVPVKKKIIPDNRECMKCHGQSVYTALSKDSTHKKMIQMSAVRHIDSAQYSLSTHGSFKCTDCHDEGYKAYPHDIDLKFKEMMTCMDCHRGNKKFKKYHFNIIEEEAKKSIHFRKIPAFTCWKCHNPHAYVNVFFKGGENKKKAIDACNNACMNCHGNKDKYSLYSKNKMPDISESHEWLPEMDRHFRNIRCTDCHAMFRDSIASLHNISEKSNAVRNCVECHTMNSRMLTTLYKFESKAERKKYGFVNSVILNNSFVIGANRIPFLNVSSFILFSAIVFGLLAHYLLWILTRKKTK